MDGKFRFLYMSAVCVGSTHDSLAFSASSLSSELANGLLPKPFYIVEDDSYTASDYLLTPISPRLAQTDSLEDAYNFFQSSLRMHVEQALAQSMSHRRLLGMSLKHSIHFNGAIVQAAMALHNFRIKQQDANIDVAIDTADKNEVESLIHYWLANNSNPYGGGRRRDLENSSTRDRVVRDIREQGLTRPMP